MKENSSQKMATPRWGMTVDINRCVGCQTCTIACKHANDTTPGVQWRSVIDLETGEYPDVRRLFLVTGCQHCAEPSCVPVCPTGATKQRADGLVTMDYELCIGCASCAVACPYQARTIVHEPNFYYGTETVQEKAVAHEERRGVAQKCTFCITRVDDGIAAGLTPGVDPEATPACAASCIASAIQFGDFNDPESHVSKLENSRDNFQIHGELGNDPQIKYLYTTPSVPGAEPEMANRYDHHENHNDPETELTGHLQTFWDMRAAMNFILGGLGSGAAVTTYIFSLYEDLAFGGIRMVFSIAAAVMAVGLFFVWLKIGRKLRAAYVILRPQTSWMSREVYAVAVFAVGLAGSWVLPHNGWLWLAALGAAGFLYAQARILQASKGIPAWRTPRMTWMLVLSGLAEGAGLNAVIAGILPHALSLGVALPIVGIILLVLSAALWRNYVDNAREYGISQTARRVLEKATPRLYVFGHLAPIIAYFWVIAWTDAPIWLLVLPGVLAIAGGAYWKAVVITRAAHQQPFMLAKFPHRGSGRYAAPLMG